MSAEYFNDKINKLLGNCIDVIELDGNNNLESGKKLIIIPEFSSSFFESNYQTLFQHYLYKLPINKFKKIIFVNFPGKIIFNLHQEFFKSWSDKVISLELLASLENSLYKKCGEIIFDKLDGQTLYSVLANSTGAGPAIFLCNSHPNIFTNLNLFAPDVKYIYKAIKKVCEKFPNTIVGWNSTDTNVRLIDVWFTLNNVLPDKTKLYTYYYSNSFGSQHEINTGFFDKIT